MSKTRSAELSGKVGEGGSQQQWRWMASGRDEVVRRGCEVVVAGVRLDGRWRWRDERDKFFFFKFNRERRGLPLSPLCSTSEVGREPENGGGQQRSQVGWRTPMGRRQFSVLDAFTGHCYLFSRCLSV